MRKFDEEAAIQKLTRTIEKLLHKTGFDYVQWEWVAKEQEGSEAYADILRGLADLPQYKHFFNRSYYGVNLSEEGWKYFKEIPKKNVSISGKITESVKRYAGSLKPLLMEIESIATVRRTEKRFVHAVYVNSANTTVPSETRVTLQPKEGTKYYGKVVGQEPDGRVLYVAFDAKIFQASLPAWLVIDRGFLLRQLATKLEQFNHLPKFALEILVPPRAEVTPIGHKDSVQVADNLASLSTPWMRFLWGPPGAGKTYAIGRIISQILRSGRNTKILLIAPSNRAVDVATEQLLIHLENDPSLKYLLNQRKILRFGYPRKREIIERPELLGPPILDQLSAKARKLAGEISVAEKTQVSEKEISILRSNLLEVQEEIKKAVNEHIQQSVIVTTTVALSYLDSSLIPQIKWNSVFVDEVTMVPPAVCTYLSSLASERFLLAGDPRQLGPVFEENYSSVSESTRRWMGYDIFEVSRITNFDSNLSLGDNRLARITSQRRCANEIWAQVQHLYPTIQYAVDENNIKGLIELPPGPDKSVVVIDVAKLSAIQGTESICLKMYNSWYNKFSAEVSILLANEILENNSKELSIAIIAPYRAQIKQLKMQIKEKRKTNRRFDFVEAGTVHQFQGSAADIIIFDLVDGNGRGRIGKLLQGKTGERLVNVAITRARGKVIILADKNWYNLHQGHNSLLDKLILDASNEISWSPKPTIKIGQEVKIMSGPFEDFSGEVTRINHSQKNVEVVINFFGRKTPVELELTQIEIHTG